MTDMKKTVNRLTISRHDFERCRDFLAALPDQEYGTITYEALLVAAIIFYSRPFSSNEKEKGAQAESRVDTAVLDNLTAEESALHIRILELRNKAVAHAEWQFHPTAVTTNKVIQSMPFSIWKYFRDTTDVELFSLLVGKVLLRANHITADMLLSMP
jgi:hypothetical protein